jgi:hypothetical protein
MGSAPYVVFQHVIDGCRRMSSMQVGFGISVGSRRWALRCAAHVDGFVPMRSAANTGTGTGTAGAAAVCAAPVGAHRGADCIDPHTPCERASACRTAPQRRMGVPPCVASCATHTLSGMAARNVVCCRCRLHVVCCMLSVACCLLQLVCCILYVSACCLLQLVCCILSATKRLGCRA